MTELSTRLLSEAKHHQMLWRANFAVAAILFLAALACSALATVFAATNTYRSLLPWLTAAPGAIILANSYFNSVIGTRALREEHKADADLPSSRIWKRAGKRSGGLVEYYGQRDQREAPTFGEFTVYPGSAKPKSKGRNQNLAQSRCFIPLPRPTVFRL